MSRNPLSKLASWKEVRRDPAPHACHRTCIAALPPGGLVEPGCLDWLMILCAPSGLSGRMNSARIPVPTNSTGEQRRRTVLMKSADEQCR